MKYYYDSDVPWSIGELKMHCDAIVISDAILRRVDLEMVLLLDNYKMALCRMLELAGWKGWGFRLGFTPMQNGSGFCPNDCLESINEFNLKKVVTSICCSLIAANTVEERGDQSISTTAFVEA